MTPPISFAYVADRALHELQRSQYIPDDDIRIEITFSREALRRIASERPDVLSIERMYGVKVTFPERESRWVDCMVDVIADHNPIEVGVSSLLTLEAVLDT